jgi:hypothetical protein
MSPSAGLRTQATMLAASILAAAAAGLAGASDAHAGTYPMYACDVPGVNLPGATRAAWTPYDSSGQIQHHDTCVTTLGRGGSYTFQINYPTGRLQQNTGVGLELRIPSSGPKSRISIERVLDWSDTQLVPFGVGEAPAYGVNLGPAVSLGPGGSSSGFDWTGTTGAGHDSGPLADGTATHQLGARCAYMGGGYADCQLPTPFLRIRGIATTLRENAAPSAAIDGGTVTLGGARKGEQTVTYTAGDDESGVERVDALLDGISVASASNARDLSRPVAQQTGECRYSALSACPATASGTLSFNTANVPDGAYALTLRVTDAAGNTRSATYPQPIVIDNVPDTVALPALPTTGAVGSATRVTPPAPPASGPDNGDGASANATVRATFAGSRRGVATSRFGRKVLIVGQLKRHDGKPIAGATLHVLHQDKTVGAAMVAAAEVTTDAQGTFRHVTTAERSRTIRIGYRARHADTAFSHAADVGLAVIAPVRLSTDRTVLRNGKAVRFRGSIPGAPGGARKVVELQVRKGRSWMTFRSTRLRDGRFSESYRFTRTYGKARYVFRARVRAESGFPFTTGYSKTVGVTVRG